MFAVWIFEKWLVFCKLIDVDRSTVKQLVYCEVCLDIVDNFFVFNDSILRFAKV